MLINHTVHTFNLSVCAPTSIGRYVKASKSYLPRRATK